MSSTLQHLFLTTATMVGTLTSISSTASLAAASATPVSGLRVEKPFIHFNHPSHAPPHAYHFVYNNNNNYNANSNAAEEKEDGRVVITPTPSSYKLIVLVYPHQDTCDSSSADPFGDFFFLNYTIAHGACMHGVTSLKVMPVQNWLNYTTAVDLTHYSSKTCSDDDDNAEKHSELQQQQAKPLRVDLKSSYLNVASDCFTDPVYKFGMRVLKIVF